MNSLPLDTTLEAARFQHSILREISPSERLEMAFELGDAIRNTLIDGIRNHHPDYSPEQVHREVLRLTLGNELYRKCRSHLPRERL